jgi:hypothetical protein
MVTVYIKHGHEKSTLAVSNRLLKGGSSSSTLHHHVSVAKGDHKAIPDVLSRPGAAHFVAFWRVSTGKITIEFRCHHKSP